MIYSPCILYIYCLYAFTSFRSSLSDARDWRLFMKSISEVYTVRSFWGKLTCHFPIRMNTYKIQELLASAHSQDEHGNRNLYCRWRFHLPKRSLVARYTKIFFVFFLSGFIHSVSETSEEMSINPYGAWVHHWKMEYKPCIALLLADPGARARCYYGHGSLVTFG